MSAESQDTLCNSVTEAIYAGQNVSPLPLGIVVFPLLCLLCNKGEGSALVCNYNCEM